jgi:hypothetical protein
MTRVVETGRRMKRAAMFIARLPSARLPERRVARPRPAADRHRRAGGQAQVAVEHDLFPALQPDSTTTSPSWRKPVVTGRYSTVPSGRMMYTYSPSAPGLTARSGTSTTSCNVPTSRVTSANWPGHNLPVRVGEAGLEGDGPGPGVHAAVDEGQVAGYGLGQAGRPGLTRRGLSACAAMMADRWASGTAKRTLTGSTRVMTTMDESALALTMFPACSWNRPGPAVDGRADLGVGQGHLRRLHGRFGSTAPRPAGRPDLWPSFPADPADDVLTQQVVVRRLSSPTLRSWARTRSSPARAERSSASRSRESREKRRSP